MSDIGTCVPPIDKKYAIDGCFFLLKLVVHYAGYQSLGGHINMKLSFHWYNLHSFLKTAFSFYNLLNVTIMSLECCTWLSLGKQEVWKVSFIYSYIDRALTIYIYRHTTYCAKNIFIKSNEIYCFIRPWLFPVFILQKCILKLVQLS